VLQNGNVQQAAAGPSSPIVLDDAAQTPAQTQGHHHRQNQAHQSNSGFGQQQWPRQHGPDTEKGQIGLASRVGVRFHPGSTEPAGYSPAFTGMPAFGPKYAAAAGISPQVRDPSAFRAVQTKSKRGSADPNEKKLDELLKALKMHTPYDPQAQLQPITSKQQATTGSTAQLDLDEVIARYAEGNAVEKASSPVDS